MNKALVKLGILSLLVSAIAFAPANTFGQEKKEKKKGNPPLRGKVAAIDKAAKTIKVGETTVNVTSETRIEKDGKPATLDDGKVGEDVMIAYTKTEDGKNSARRIWFGQRPEGEGKKKGDGTKKE